MTNTRAGIDLEKVREQHVCISMADAGGIDYCDK